LDLVIVLEQIVILGHIIELLFVTVQLLLVLKLIAVLILLVIIARFRFLHWRFFLDLLRFFKECRHNLLRLDILVEEVQTIFNLLNFANLPRE